MEKRYIDERILSVLSQAAAGVPIKGRCQYMDSVTRHFTCGDVDLAGWTCAMRSGLMLTQPGKPTQNAYIESFNDKF